ncbi:MAG TPA: nucleotide sugar dehydrogenase [Candidatus Limnocylindrales bacterium]|nr:nucleotide sugar dehydrogenase [Candidatus Limnocylindrales bacterium]
MSLLTPSRPDHAGDSSGETDILTLQTETIAAEQAVLFAEVMTTVRPVAIVGLGYVGLPTALSLHVSGASVIGIDVSEARLDGIRHADVDLVAADRERLAGALGSERFVLSTDATRLADAGTVIICVPTPVDSHLAPDLTLVRRACEMVVAQAVQGQTIILTSTVHVGCTREMLVEPLAARGFDVGTDIHVAFSPERIDPGNTRFPQETVPRVLGGVTPASTARAAQVLGRVSRVVPVESLEAAELTKLYENTFRAVNIALANEMTEICRTFGVDAVEVVQAAETKPYGFMPFYGGTGVGGHCIPCDPHYLLWSLRASGGQAPLIALAMDEIAARPREIVRQAIESLADLGVRPAEARVLVLGVAYKAGIADVRESPALEILEGLRRRGVTAVFSDPLVASVRLPGGETASSIAHPERESFDLIVINVLHPDVDHHWLASRAVLDPGNHVSRRVRRLAAAHVSAGG